MADSARTSDRRRPNQLTSVSSRSASLGQRTRTDADSWVEISSQPSSSSLSSVADEIVTTGLRVHHNERHNRRRRTLRPAEAALITPARQESTESSSQEEYEESESESDRVMTSSGEEPQLRHTAPQSSTPANLQPQQVPDSDDENRTAVNYPLNTGSCFTPQPNAFSHPPSAQMRSTSQPNSGSYFPTMRRVQSNTLPRERSQLPRNMLGTSYTATHDEALRASLSTLLSCAAAARGLKSEKQPQPEPMPLRRVQPMTLQLVPESALPVTSPHLQEPVFRPTLRRASTTTVSTSPDRKAKRRSRPSSKERSAAKKARHAEDFYLTPTLLTWVVSAGVVVVLSALSFSAGYSMGKEAGKLEAGLGSGTDEMVRSCAREASRSSLGLKRSLARSAVHV